VRDVQDPPRYGSLSDVHKLSVLVENIRISGTSNSEEGRRKKWAEIG
jgi:hypothetical protein